jgi:hypothetical protein
MTTLEEGWVSLNPCVATDGRNIALNRGALLNLPVVIVVTMGIATRRHLFRNTSGDRKCPIYRDKKSIQELKIKITFVFLQ